MKAKSLYDHRTGRWYGAITDGAGTVLWVGKSIHYTEGSALDEANAEIKRRIEEAL